jgi:hypothetical protein
MCSETRKRKASNTFHTTAGGKDARVRVQRVGKRGNTEIRIWRAHERVSVTRATAEEASNDATRTKGLCSSRSPVSPRLRRLRPEKKRDKDGCATAFTGLASESQDDG